MQINLIIGEITPVFILWQVVSSFDLNLEKSRGTLGYEWEITPAIYRGG